MNNTSKKIKGIEINPGNNGAVILTFLRNNRPEIKDFTTIDEAKEYVRIHGLAAKYR